MSCNWTWMEFHMIWIGNQSVTKTQRSTDAVFKWWTPKHPKTIGIFRLKSLVLAMKTWPCRDDFRIPPWLGPRFQLPGYPHFRWERQADPAAEIHIYILYIYMYIHDLQVILCIKLMAHVYLIYTYFGVDLLLILSTFWHIVANSFWHIVDSDIAMDCWSPQVSASTVPVIPMEKLRL
jgi:hypothetical protein